MHIIEPLAPFGKPANCGFWGVLHEGFDRALNRLRLQNAPHAQLESVLPPLLQNLSIARGQIALDQARIATTDHPDSILLVTASESDDSPPLAAALVLKTAGVDPISSPDSATVVHIGPLVPMGPAMMTMVATQLAHFLDRLLLDQGVRFVQWSTDPMDDSDITCDWCKAMGFAPIAQLEYLSGSVATSHDDSQQETELRWTPVDWSDPKQALIELAKLVERTYIDTEDCPQLAQYRSALQSLDGYRQSPAFDPNLWFHVHDRQGSLAGCVVLSRHRQGKDDDVIELVYMGLVPEARGKGLGRLLLGGAIETCHRVGVTQMIMAVDRNNVRARGIYHQAGFQPILRERVWVKSLG